MQVRVTAKHNDECKKMLALMGVPYVEVSLEVGVVCKGVWCPN